MTELEDFIQRTTEQSEVPVIPVDPVALRTAAVALTSEATPDRTREHAR